MSELSTDFKKPTVSLRRLTDMVEVRDEESGQIVMLPAGIEANRLSLALVGHKIRRNFVTQMEKWMTEGIEETVPTKGGFITTRREVTPQDMESFVKTAEGIQRITSIAYGDGRNLLSGEDLRVSDVVRNVLAAAQGFVAGVQTGAMPLTPGEYAKKARIVIREAVIPKKKADDSEVADAEIVE